jgi:hypothetical protein
MSEKTISEVIKDSLKNQATKIVDSFVEECGIQGETKEVIVEKLVVKGLESLLPLLKEALGASLDIGLGPILSSQVQFLLEVITKVLDKKGGDFFKSCLEAFQGLSLTDAQEKKLLSQLRIATESLKKDLTSIPEAVKEVAKIVKS